MLNSRLTIVTHRRERRFLVVLVAVVICLFSTVKPVSSQPTDEDGASRKLVTRVEPEYPETLKRLFIGGIVRVEVSVNPNGTVESTQLLGGNPILGQSAMKAIRQWRFTPAMTKAKFVVKVAFDPHNN